MRAAKYTWYRAAPAGLVMTALVACSDDSPTDPGENGTGEGPDPDPIEVTVSGEVADGESGEPVEGAAVSVHEDDTTLDETTTDGEGAFELDFTVVEEDAPESVRLEVEADDYRPAEETVEFAEELEVNFTLEVQRYSGGAGTAADPYQVATVEDLQAIEDELDAHFVQVADIDASETAQWNGGDGFRPIGRVEEGEPLDSDEHEPFTGSFDGNGHVIENLAIDRSDDFAVALFGVVADASFEDVSLTGLSVVGGSAVAGLVGAALSGIEIREVHTSGEVGGETGVGGILGGGFELSVVEHSNSETTISAANGFAGGLVGDGAHGVVIEDSEAFGEVESSGVGPTGGLVGAIGESSELRRAFAHGDVAGEWPVGGLIGVLEGGQVQDSRASGEVDGDELVGGLIGRMEAGVVRRSFAEGAVEGTREVGGLVGIADGGTVRASFAAGSVSGDSWFIGGLVGILEDEATVRESHARGNISGGSEMGGLVGVNRGAIIESYSVGEVDGGGYWGGFAGVNEGTIAISYWDAESSDVAAGVGAGDDDGVVGLTTDEMTGSDATDHMSGFDFDEIWAATASEYPLLWWQE